MKCVPSEYFAANIGQHFLRVFEGKFIIKHLSQASDLCSFAARSFFRRLARLRYCRHLLVQPGSNAILFSQRRKGDFK